MTLGRTVAPACDLHPGAEFCVRSNEATSGGTNTGIGNQVCVWSAIGMYKVFRIFLCIWYLPENCEKTEAAPTQQSCSVRPLGQMVCIDISLVWNAQ